MATQLDESITVLNSMTREIAALADTRDRINHLITQWTNLGVANHINAMPTAPLLTTGALGTADGSPNVANPIDTRVNPSVNFAVSANDYASMVTYIQGIVSAINGSAVSVNGAAPQLIAKSQ